MLQIVVNIAYSEIQFSIQLNSNTLEMEVEHIALWDIVPSAVCILWHMKVIQVFHVQGKSAYCAQQTYNNAEMRDIAFGK